MKRRDFVAGGVLGLAVGAGAGWFARGAGGKTEKIKPAPSKPKAPVVLKGVKQLRMVTSWPKNFPGLGTAASRFARRIEQASQGRYTIKVFAAGELVKALDCNDAVQQGTADLYHSADYYFQRKSQAYAWFTAVPGGFSPAEMNAWIFHLGGQKLWDEVGAQFDIKHLPAGNSGHQMAGWFRNPITSLEDFKGLKMRIPGLGGAMINALGGTAVTLEGAEILPALQTGRIDATEWIGPWGDLVFGFYKVVKIAHYPGIHEPGSMFSLGISKKLWDGFPASDQALFTACAQAENSYDLAEFNANNAQALKTLVVKHGVSYRPLPEAVFKGMAEAAKDVVASAGAKDALSAKVYDSYLQARKTLSDWTRVSDKAYFNLRDLVKY
ncbi:MAG: TRAP transporter substrate-binding protein [Alphaproteobacteria bacterium]